MVEDVEELGAPQNKRDKEQRTENKGLRTIKYSIFYYAKPLT